MPATAENRIILTDANGRQLIVAEQSTLVLTATLIDDAGAAIPSAGVQALTLTLYNRDSAAKEVLNSVDGQNILNADRGTLHPTSGLLTVTLLPADNAIIDTTKDLEWHRALVQATYATTKKFKAEIDFPVRNLNKVT